MPNFRLEGDSVGDLAILDACLGYSPEQVEERWPLTRRIADRYLSRYRAEERWKHIHQYRGSDNFAERAKVALGEYQHTQDRWANAQRYGFGSTEFGGLYASTHLPAQRLVVRHGNKAERRAAKSLLATQLRIAALLSVDYVPRRATLLSPKGGTQSGKTRWYRSGPYVAPLGCRLHRGAATVSGLSKQLALALDWLGRSADRGRLPAPRWRHPDECLDGMPKGGVLRLRNGMTVPRGQYGEGDMALTAAIAFDGTLLTETSEESWGLGRLERRDLFGAVVGNVAAGIATANRMECGISVRNRRLQIVRWKRRGDSQQCLAAALDAAPNGNARNRKFNSPGVVVTPEGCCVLVPRKTRRSTAGGSGSLDWSPREGGEVAAQVRSGPRISLPLDPGELISWTTWDRDGLRVEAA